MQTGLMGVLLENDSRKKNYHRNKNFGIIVLERFWQQI
jgi:hypothetical protein